MTHPEPSSIADLKKPDIGVGALFRVAVNPITSAAIALAAVSCLIPTPSYGNQTTPGTTETTPAHIPCRVVDALPEKATDGGAGMLVAVCGNHGRPIGPATHFLSALNSRFGSALIVRQYGPTTDVILASISPGETSVHLDDLTNVLIKLGTGASSFTLNATAIDTSRFGLDGSISITIDGVVKKVDTARYSIRPSVQR